MVTKPKAPKASPISDLLRSTISKSEIPLLVLQKETGVQRASIMRFLRGEQSLRLDVADKLAAYFGLVLTSSSSPRPRVAKKVGRPNMDT
jgi:plasmid maintenance system antidote protein VapI